MEQNRIPLSDADIESCIESMRRRGKHPEEVYQLARDDLKRGLTREEIRLYTDKNYTLRQMVVCSNCLRKGYSPEALELVCQKDLDTAQMETVYENIEAGIPLDVVKEIIEKSDGKGHQMEKMFASYREKKQSGNNGAQTVEADNKEENLGEEQKTKEESKEADSPMPEYLKIIVENLQAASNKLSEQENNYKELSEKLKTFEEAKEDASVIRSMEKEIAEKDELLLKQQEDIQKANSAVARLRKEKEDMEQEMKTMKDKMQKQMDDLAKEQRKAEEIPKKEQNVTPPAESVAVAQQTQTPYGIPVYYKVPVIDSSGQIVQRVQVERAVSKDRGIAGMFGKLAFRHKSRADIVKLVASGDLVPAQLVQIKIAIEKGLTENQIVELINNNVAAEKMKEIIEIAVLENSMN
ncbi:MAG: hypothetical protein IJ733_20300 [Lachnospiraceae bacterium]|nr:hypothetical protein [Lachnospiraceae bacterium]